MSSALHATNNDCVSCKPLRDKWAALGEYKHHVVGFGLAEIPASSFWPVMWALMLNRCGAKRGGMLASMGHLVQHDGGWTVQPLTVTMDSQATVASVVNDVVFQGNPVLGGEKSFHTDTLVGVVANGEVADEDLLAEVAQCMTQWDLVLALAVVGNKKLTQHQVHFVYRPAQMPADTVVQLADQFLRMIAYVNHNGLNITLANVHQCIGESTFTLPLYRRQPLADCNAVKHEYLVESQSEKLVVASTEQTRIWHDSQKYHHRFYHLVVIRAQEAVDSARVQSAIHRLTKQFPILVNRFVEKLGKVLRYEAIDASNLVARVTIEEAFLNEPDKLRPLLHDAHRLDDADHPLFSVVELVPNGSDRIEWLSVYCHYVLGDHSKFHCWVEQFQNLMSNPLALALPVLDENGSGDGLDPTEFWKTHFSDDALYLDLDGKPSQPLNHTCHANRYEPAIPSSLVSHLPLLMELMSMSYLELLQGFMTLFVLRLARQSSVTLFGQADHNSVVPWVAQTTDEISAKDALHSLIKQYRQSTHYNWSQFSFPLDSRKPSIRVTTLSMLPGYAHDFGQPYAETPLSLTWLHSDVNSALRLVVDYDKGVYQMATVEHLVKNFLFFTSQCCVDITQDWRDVGVVHPDEQGVLLNEFAINKHDYDPYNTMAEGVMDLFIRNVGQYPESVAVECGDHRETYRSLYEKVQALVTHFHSLGIQRQERIAVIVESNGFTIMTLLALWTLGTVYVPIDSQLPQKRQQYMIETAGCKRILSTTFTKPDWIDTIAVQEVLDSTSSNKVNVILPDDNIKHLPDEIAYIMFTSGTTGQPKGIIVHYGAFNNLIVTHPLFAQESPRDSRWLLTFGVAFDAYLYGTFLSLCYGWTLVLASHEIIMDVLPTIHGIYSTPSFISALNPDNVAMMKWAFIGGEALPQTLSDKWSSHCRLYNGYGPAETTIVTTIKEMKPDDRVTIGRPLPNYECYILDSQQQLLPIGIVGEIYIGGVGVSQGYINLPEINETRFIPNSLTAGRFYRTGDYGRWLLNGELECLGRVDDQVKVRGFRVELGEVRGAMLKQPGVRDAFVILVDGKQLAGFVISHHESDINEDTLRMNLEKYLPLYLAPQDLFSLESIPPTVVGKIDKHSLKITLKQLLAYSDERLVKGPTNATEQAIHQAMGKALGISLDHLDVRESFFQLGGDSILAIRFSSLCPERGIQLSIAQIFWYKSVVSLSELVGDMEITNAPLPSLDPWELTLLDYGSTYIPTETITFVVAEELLSVFPSTLSPVIQTIFTLNSRYDSVGRRLVHQSHSVVIIEQDAEASHRLNPSEGVWLSGTYTRECNGLNVVTLVAHLVPLGRVGGWSTIFQGMVKQCPDLATSPNPSTMDTLSCSHGPKCEIGTIHQITMSYPANPFRENLLHSGLHAPLSVVIMAGFLMALQELQAFDSVGIVGSGHFARYLTKRLNSEESTSHTTEFQVIKQWYYDHLIHGDNPDKPEAPVLYHYSDVTQSHGIPLVEQRTSFWDTMYGMQAAVIYQPSTLVLQLCHQDATFSESLLATWEDQVNRLYDIPGQLRGTEHAFIPADFPHLTITSNDLDELMSEIHQDLSIPPATVQDVYPLSTMQQNFVVNTLRDPTSYIVQHVFHITGALDLIKYRTVWDELGLRHTILRTKFLASRMVQIVTDRVDIDWLVSDVSLSTSNEEYQHTVRQRGFNLFGGHPLLRIHLFPDGDGHGWLCFMAIHHALIDGWSYQLLMNESLSLYHDLPLMAKVPYRQFIDAVSTRDNAADQKYWAEFLEGFESTPDVPFPHLTQVGLYRKDVVVLSQTESLHRLCGEWGITFNVFLRGVWALMLTQYLGKPSEVTFGVMVSGRDGQIDGLDRLVGPTINTLPFRAKVDPQKPVVEWLQELSEQSTQLLEHEQASLVDIKHWTGLDADDQLFRSMVAVGQYLESESPVEASLIEYHSLSGYNDTEYRLMASFDEPVSGGALHLTILARHEPFYVDGLIDCIGHLLTQFVAANPALLSVEALLLPSPIALAQVQAWIPGPIVTPHNPNVVMVPELFTQHLDHQPQQVALETKDGQYTYRKCYTQACRIGRALLDRGLQPGDKVALLFTRSAWYFMALLGTWLVGGVAVPMDATNTPSRLQYMVDALGEDAFLVTRGSDDSGQVTLPDYYTAKIVLDNLDILAGSVSDLPAYPRDPTMLALIIYTSGTTGVPKGVMLRHESILNFISYGTQFMSLSSTSRFLQALNIVFDGCFIEILTVWSVGGTLLLQDAELVDDLKRVTHCLLTPSMLGVLNPEDYPQLELVSTIGEALPCNVANRWLATGKRVLNAFGPAEITMACHLDLVLPHEPVSIGRPIANAFCYILDDQHNLVPPGVPGEICIAGIGVCSGYWKRPDLATKAFIDNPFGSGKMYFTGDLGCWLPSGKVHYIGRKDNQVKLRGFRIELGDVESWCERMNSTIQQAVALIVNKQLVTYVSPQSVDVIEMKQALKRVLPYYMVPTHVIPLDDIPQTRNGKVDRKALIEYPLPEAMSSNISFTDNASQFSDSYRLVARLALQALQFAEDHPLPVPTISFFAMGGDSISAITFSTLCRKQGMNVTVAKIFTLHTLGAIATECETNSAKDNGEVQVSTLTHFQRWLSEEQRGSADMVVEVQDTDQPLHALKQPLGFTSANEWQGVLGERNSTQMEISDSSEPINTTDTGTTAEWNISSSAFAMFTTDKLYGQYQCTLSELLLAGFLMAWWKTQQGNVNVDLFRLTDNELVNTHWLQETLAKNLQSPLVRLQYVKQVARNASWSDISSSDDDHPRVLFHMVDPVLGRNIVRQRQQSLTPLLGERRRYDLEAMLWYQVDGTVTLVIHWDSLTNCETDEKFVQALPNLWKHAMEELLECNYGTAWLPGDFPLVPFEDIQQLTIEPTYVQTVWPLSSLQQGFVIESLKDPSAYMVQLVYELHGVLDVDRYHQAWFTVGQRHDAMRVQFYPDQSVQVVMRDFHLEWHYGEQVIPDADIHDYLIRMRERGFVDLTSEPLLRVQLLQQKESGHLCLITIHHAVLDAWSIDIVLGEVRRVYHGLPLTTKPVSYAEFLNHVAKVDPTQTQSFWKEYLHGMEPTPDLPIPKLDANPVESVTHRLSTPLRSISTWCGKLGITVNSLLRGLWALLLGRYLGQDTCEVTFAVMVTGRDGEIDGIDEMVGLTVNTVPFRVKLERADSMDTWLKAIHAQSGPLMDHGHVGLLDIETWTNQKSPFQSMLVNSKSRTKGFGIASDAVADKLQWVSKGGYNQGNFPLTVGFTEIPVDDDLEVKIVGNHGKTYFAGLITYLDFCLSTLVKATDTASDWTLGRMLDLIPSTELNRIAIWSQGTHASYDGKPRLVHELVTGNNEESKLADIALESLDSPLILTYGELISQSQLIAQYLLSLDYSGQFVFLFFRHSSAFLVAMLGTLMAGKTCVPMNVEHASERLVGMTQTLGEAHPVVLTSQDHRSTAQELFGDTIFCVDEMTLSAVTSKSRVEWKPPHVNPSDIAMVYFTSGSTGKPKAVPQRHESIVNCILGTIELLNLSKDCRCLQTFNIGFDGSLLMLFMPLYVGGTLVLPGDNMIQGLNRTDTCILTPSILQAAGDPKQYNGLRTVVVGGEPLSHALAKKWSQAYDGQLKIINGYGPTETTVESHIEVVHSRSNSLISIGRTLPNVQCYILDDALRMVPIGAMGEICIGGIGVCNGYLHDERRSRNVFVSNPFDSGILYRTGDQGCWLPDGRVYCKGRKDNQVKLRGFRIELAEVESWCERLNFNIQQAVALVVNKQLVTYVSPQSVDVDKVKESLSQALPYYMVPTHIIPLDDIPKTRNGKVDRRALAEYPLPRTLTSDITYMDNASEFGETYRMVARLALQALQCAEDHPLPSPSTSFFAMGGDSISAVTFSSLCRKQGMNVTVAKIFTLHTLGAIATECETNSAKDNGEVQVSTLTHFQRWLSEEQRGSADMVVEVQDTDQPLHALKQPLGFTSANEWQSVLGERNSTQMEISDSSEPTNTTDTGTTAEWNISSSAFAMFTTDKLYGQYQCTLSELLLAGFLMAWWKTQQGNVNVDLFRLTDNELVNTHWLQETLAKNLQSPLVRLQYVKQVARNASWSDISSSDDGHPRVLFHMVDPVLGRNIVRQRQQSLAPLLGERRRYALEAMMWYQVDGTVTLVIHWDSLTNCETDEKFVQALPNLWKHAMEELLECNYGTAWLPGDFPLVPFKNIQQLTVNPTRVQTMWPLSSLQQGFVIESLKDPSAYMVQLVYKLHGVLDVDRYHQAWLTVGQRHDAMRVQFHPDQSVQVVMRDFNLEWDYGERIMSDDEVPGYLLRMRQRGFTDLTKEPLLRIQLLKQNPALYLCFVTAHHAILDAWSIDLVLGEVRRAYEGLTLTTSAVSYGRFLAHTTTIDPTQTQSFWETYLENMEPTPNLPFPTPENSPLESVTGQLSTSLSLVRTWCTKLGITVNSLVRGLWALLLGRYLGKDTREVTFGVMLTGRDGEIDGVDEMVGLTVNTVPFRVTLNRSRLAYSWLQEIHTQSGAMLSHGHIGLLEIESWVKQKPLFQSMLVNDKSRAQGMKHSSAVGEEGLRWVNRGGYNEVGYPLTASFTEDGEINGMHIQLSGKHGSGYYSSLVAYLNTILETLIGESPPADHVTVGSLLDQIPGLELEHIQTWSQGTCALYDGKPRLVHDFVLQGKLPSQLNTIALVSLTPPLEFTYCVLITRAQLVAQRLMALDTPSRFVILFFERSPAFVLSMLGTLIAGKTCVPMDATHTSERLTGMYQSLGETQPVVLTSQEYRDTAEKLFGDDIICVDDLAQSVVGNLVSSDWNPPPMTPADVAFVYFTSGSTGKPKAVPVRHESVVNCILGWCGMLNLPPRCRFLQAMNIGFDSSLFELFTTFHSGGTVVLQSDDLMVSLGKVDACVLTPSMLQAVGNPAEYPGLRVLVTGGEPLPFALAEKWSQTPGCQVQLFNGYGPTETGVTSHFDQVTVTRNDRVVTIGRTIPNVQCYILDDALDVVPIGVIGEICIGGVGVCYGYLHDEERSRDVFVPNPFAPGMLYHTGDLGCWLPDGRVYCMGRKDNQVKLRGFRVGLAEVESWCERLNFNIQQAVALVVNKQLVTYVSPQSVDVDKVKESLSQALPYYMVPTHIIPLDDIPKTRNGKVDRRALAEYPLPRTLTSDITYMDNASEFGETYRMVTRLALQALRFAEDHPLPSPSTSFFAMGGDSISAVTFSSLCRKQGMNVTVAKIFTLHTLGAIATECETNSAKDNGEVQVSTLTHFQRWLSEEQRGSADMVVEVQDTDQPLHALKQPLGFTSANEWQSVLGERNSTQMEIGSSSEPTNTTDTGTTAEWNISSSAFAMFTTDKLYGQYQCTLSELLLAGFLMAWWKTQQGNVNVDLFRLTDNELVNTHWLQETLAKNLQSPLVRLQYVKQVARNASWSDISSSDDGHPRVLFHMVDPVLGRNIVRQRQQRLVPLLATRQRYALEAMIWYQMDGTVTLVIHRDSLTNNETDEKFVQTLPTLWKHAMEELLECNAGTAWLPCDFPLVPFEDVQKLTVNPVCVQTMWPLSSLQQGFVIESLKDPSAYMVQLVYKLHGVLDVDRYHQAWLTVGQRHDAMRVQFHPDQSVQVVMRDFNLEWDYGERIMSDDEVPGYLLRMRQRGFTDLTKEPLLRIQLLKQNPALYLCFVTAHHAILDAWSIDVVLGEVRRAYEGLTLTTSAVSYGRFLAHTTTIDPTQTQSFWETYLENMEPTPNLPFPTPENSTLESVTERLSTSLSLVRTWCTKLGITVNSLVRGLWALLLGRYLGKDTREVTFGVMLTGRDGEIDGVDEMVGLTVNTVPFRVTLNRSRLAYSWLQEIHTQSGAMLSHGHIGLLEIESWVKQKPLFQSMLVNDKSRAQGMKHSSAVGEEGLRWVNKGGYNEVGYPLTASFTEDGEINGMHIQLSGKHGSSYYSALVVYLNTVLEKMVVESSSHDHLTVGNLLDQIPRLELERIQTWSQGTRALYDGKPRLVHDLVLQGKLPSQLKTVALVSLTPPLEFTYYVLITRAQLVAQRLMAVNRSSRFVILFFERSPVFVLSMLGTLIAGKTCVPMDATHTSERLIGMYESLGVTHPVVLTSQEYRDTAEKLFGNTIICMDDLAQPSVDNLVSSSWKPPSITPTDVAFVYFTSGSTGKPKAVPERHESVVNYILGGCDILNLPQRCRFLQAMNVGFDSCLLEFFTALHSGGTVVLQSEDLMYSLGKVDACMLTPSMLQAVGSPSEYPDLRVVVTVGEPLPFSLAEKWSQTPGCQVRLFNTYGPTETVVTSHFEHVTVTHDDRLVTIGRTIPNVQCYILDDALDMVPIGVIGEICIGGIGVCNRYLNDEQRSRDAFVPNPFGSGLLYCTGDLGCWLPDGRVYCMGRKDSQVKLHGFRVELGEVEQAIRNSSATITMENACVVYVHGEGKLMGYVTPRDVDSESVLSALWERLPSYMVPDHIIPVDKFPLTSNGKVDRKALLTSHPPADTFAITVSPTPTMTPLQHQLVSILCTMLKLNPNRVHLQRDTFFTLGGNSLSAMHFVSRCKADGIRLAMADINRGNTLAGLAKLAVERAGDATMDLQPPEFTHGPFSLTPVQRLYFSWDLTDLHQWPLPLLMKLTTPRSLDEWRGVVTSLVSRHDMMRARFDQVDGEWQGRVLPIDEDPVVVNQCTLAAETDYWRVIDETHTMMNITTGPIYLAYVMNYRDTQYFYLSLHHLIADNTSMNILAQDVSTLLSGQSLSYKTLPYPIWSQNLDGLSDRVSLKPGQLPTEGELTLPPSDVDPTPHSPFIQRDQLVISNLDASTAFALDQFGYCDITAEDIILTGLLLAYTDVFNCDSIPLQYTSHGRNALGNSWDVSHTVGFFVNFCPIVLRRNEGNELASTVGGVQSVLRGVSDFAVKYMLSGQTMKSPIAYNFLGKHDISDSAGTKGLEVIDIVASDEFQEQRVNMDPIPLIFLAKYTGECLPLMISYESSRYSEKCMSAVMEKWEEGVRHILLQLKSQE